MELDYQETVEHDLWSVEKALDDLIEDTTPDFALVWLEAKLDEIRKAAGLQ
jgi:hypothetical protein